MMWVPSTEYVAKSFVDHLYIEPSQRRVTVPCLRRNARTTEDIGGIPEAFRADPMGYVRSRMKAPVNIVTLRPVARKPVKVADIEPATSLPIIEGPFEEIPAFLPVRTALITRKESVRTLTYDRHCIAKAIRKSDKWGKSIEVVRSEGAGVRISEPTFASIVEAVCERYGITRNEFMSFRRQQVLVYARQEAWWIAKQETTKSFVEIGRLSSGRDHTTVLYGVRQHQARLDAIARAAE